MGDKDNGRFTEYFFTKVKNVALKKINFLVLGENKHTIEIMDLVRSYLVGEKLRKENDQLVKDWLQQDRTNGLVKEKSNKVWVCWLQGIENSPDIVKACYNSLKVNLTDREIILITEKNMHEYVQFPEYIVEKYKSGIISRTLFSDLLRMELLIKYGGTWIDSTVLCTSDKVPKYIFDSDLFVYQFIYRGKMGRTVTFASWFMTSCSNNNILLLTRELIYEYFKKRNYVLDYFLFLHYFQIATEVYSDEWNKIIPVSKTSLLTLENNLFDKYNEDWYKYITDITCFHKLTYKFDEFYKNDKYYLSGNFSDTNYEYILKEYYKKKEYVHT